MENSKKKEKKRRKLRTLILLLFVTIIMFGTSTYAWFTANQTVTIQSIDVRVETSDGLQISTDGSTWKSVITQADIKDNAYTGHNNFIPNILDAVSTDGTIIANGTNKTKYLDFYYSNINTDQSSGNYTIATTQINETTDKTKFVAFDIFLKVSSAKDVYLNTSSTGSNVVMKAGSSDRGLKNAARVAFVPIGEAAADATVANITSAYSGTTTAQLKIWEPNSDTHSDIVVNSVSTEYDITLTETGQNTALYNPVSYWGITDAIPTTTPPATPHFLIETVNGTETTYTTAMSAGTVAADQETGKIITSTGILYPTPNTLDLTKNYKVFRLAAGITKMRIYMWIEGQDIDCENNASGTDITFNLEFTIPSATQQPSQQPSQQP